MRHQRRVRQPLGQLRPQGDEERVAELEQAAGQGHSGLARGRADGGRRVGHVPGRLAQDAGRHRVVLGAGGHLGREGREDRRTVGPRVDPAGKPVHRAEHLLGACQQPGRTAGAAVVRPQCRLQPGAPDPGPPPQSPSRWPQPSARRHLSRSVPIAISPVPATITAPGRAPRAPAVRGDRVGDQRDPAHPQLARQRRRQLGAQLLAERREPGGADGHRGRALAAAWRRATAGPGVAAAPADVRRRYRARRSAPPPRTRPARRAPRCPGPAPPAARTHRSPRRARRGARRPSWQTPVHGSAALAGQQVVGAAEGAGAEEAAVGGHGGGVGGLDGRQVAEQRTEIAGVPAPEDGHQGATTRGQRSYRLLGDLLPALAPVRGRPCAGPW